MQIDPGFVLIGTNTASEPKATQFTDTGLSLGISYYYKVEAVTQMPESMAAGNSSGFASPADVLKVEAPENLLAVPRDPDSITVSWDAVEGATQYNIYRYDVPFFVLELDKLLPAAQMIKILKSDDLPDDLFQYLIETEDAALDDVLQVGQDGIVKAESYIALQLNAQKIWAFCKVLGMTDEQCAGVLGNMMVESGLDQTAVEGIFTEPFKIGPRKEPLFDGNDITPDMEKYTKLTLFGTYAAYGLGINTFSYPFKDGRFCAGLGLIQFTGPMAEDLLRYARLHDRNWFDLELQLAAVIDVSDTARNRFQLFMNDIADSVSVYGATSSWLGIMEMGIDEPSSIGIGFGRRHLNAQQWYDMLSANSNDITEMYRSFAESALSITGK